MASSSTADRLIPFRCNICGKRNSLPRSAFEREQPSCAGCGSTVRTRSVIRMLARELFHTDLELPDFPVLKSIRGIGMSDSQEYASQLAARLDYRNTFYDREPRLDIVNPDESEFGQYDFIISSEVLEHVVAPVDIAFGNLFRMLKPHGVLLLTVPYELEGATVEHYGPMTGFSLATVEDRTVLVRRSAAGGYEVFDNLVFHGGQGSTLEMRVFSEAGLREQMASAGFSSIAIHGEDCPASGILHEGTWSLPIAARKDPHPFASERAAWALTLNEELRKARLDIANLKAELQLPLPARVMRKLGRPVKTNAG